MTAESSSGKIAFARAFSIVGHPMVLVPAAIAFAMRGRVTGTQAIVILGTVLAAIAIVGAYLVYGVRTGRLSHVDASTREERSSFYRIALVAMAGATAALHFAGAPPAAVYGTASSLGLLAVGSFLNRWIRASLHTAFAVVAAGTVGVGTPLLFAAFVLMAAGVAWSRPVLGRHTQTEVVVGAILGVLASLALTWARDHA
jgi:hypothetical protein